MRGLVAGCRLGLLVLAGSAVLSCQENDSMLFVRGAMHREPGNCALTIDGSATLLTNGVYDIAFGQAYTAALLVGNQLASRGDKTRSRTETSTITLEGAEVTLWQPSGELLKDTFTAPGAGFIEVGTGEDTGYGVISIVVIPGSSAGAALGKEVEGGYTIAEIRVFGKTLGGQEVESGIFKFPISVCNGCLVRYPASAMSAENVCEVATEAEATQPCLLGQDDPISCAACAGNYEICRVPPP